MKKKSKALNALIFIDTNIFLDFYRMKNQNISMKYLDEIIKHKDRIITSEQVEMEFKKNRQKVLMNSFNSIKNSKISDFESFTVFSDTTLASQFSEIKKNFDKNKQKFLKKIKILIKEPKNDLVFKKLEVLFKNNSSINLNRDMDWREEIRELAQKRFILGYPPRKNSDNSIGDAINWEWIIRCAQDSKKHIILVTRDEDFGTTKLDDSYLNDWLSTEFKERVAPRRKIILTKSLATAFQKIDISVDKKMIDEEAIVISESLHDYHVGDQFSDLNRRIQEIRKAFDSIDTKRLTEQTNTYTEEIKKALENLK